MSLRHKATKKHFLSGQQDTTQQAAKRQIGSGHYAGLPETRLDRFCRSLWPYFVLAVFLPVILDTVLIMVDGLYLRQGQIANPAGFARDLIFTTYVPISFLLWLSSPWWMRALVVKVRAALQASRHDRAYAALQSPPLQPGAASVGTPTPQATAPTQQPSPGGQPPSQQVPSIFSDD